MCSRPSCQSGRVAMELPHSSATRGDGPPGWLPGSDARCGPNPPGAVPPRKTVGEIDLIEEYLAGEAGDVKAKLEGRLEPLTTPGRDGRSSQRRRTCRPWCRFIIAFAAARGHRIGTRALPASERNRRSTPDVSGTIAGQMRDIFAQFSPAEANSQEVGYRP